MFSFLLARIGHEGVTMRKKAKLINPSNQKRRRPAEEYRDTAGESTGMEESKLWNVPDNKNVNLSHEIYREALADSQDHQRIDKSYWQVMMFAFLKRSIASIFKFIHRRNASRDKLSVCNT